MSNVLTDERRRVRNALVGAGFDAWIYRPERVDPPCALVVPSEPYITYGGPGETTFGKANVNLDIILIAGKGDNEDTTERLDAMVIDALQAVDYSQADVSSYYLVTLAGVGDCLAASIAMPRRVALP